MTPFIFSKQARDLVSTSEQNSTQTVPIPPVLLQGLPVIEETWIKQDVHALDR